MNIKLTWEDLIVDSFDQEEAESWLSNWDGILSGQLSPLFMTKFGDWFLRRPNGTTEMLDIIDGNLSVVAQTPEEFQQFMNDPAWQEEFLLSLVVYGFHEKGIIPRVRVISSNIVYNYLINQKIPSSFNKTLCCNF